MSLNWNEIKKRAIEFSKEWENVSGEKAEAKTFWDEFFNIFGITRRRIASFEEPVKKLGDKQGYIDLFWKGNLIVEHKSSGKDLDKAYTQAIDYFPGIKDEELPKFVLVSDFKRFRLYNLEENTSHQFNLIELYKNINYFDFVLGFKKQKYQDEDPVNIQAAQLMGLLHDALKNNGYTGHQLEVFLVRILFCMFADDTSIFQKGHFEYYIKNRTKPDGSDLGIHLANIFQTLNIEESKRQKNLDEDVNAFPYVNGDLFSESLQFPSFDSSMRSVLMECSGFDWSRISPAIFGSLFQSVMDKDKRRDLGAHYTSEKNIMKVIKGLFLDELHSEFEECKLSPAKLEKFHEKISNLKFLDPACGCGNFLIIAYRELRLLEMKILKALFSYQRREHLDDGTAGQVRDREIQLRLEAKEISRIDVDCMYGIEIEEFPARIAEVAMWLIDHQMNMKLSEEFGEYFARIPLKKSPHIVNKNALRLDWNDVLPKNQCSYILGNPPFVGKQLQNKEQKEDLEIVLNSIKNYGSLDYVTAWYIKAADYIFNKKIKVAFVSTNSISQGEQVGILWNELYKKYHLKIFFAHRTFKWDNEAKGKAHVFVVIIGFANFDILEKYIFEYETVKSEPHCVKVNNINPYLVGGNELLLDNRSKPLCNVPEMYLGNVPRDDGNFIFTKEEKNDFIKIEPNSERFFKPLIGGKEFLNNSHRWCLWLKDTTPTELKQMPEVLKRVENIKKFRLNSTREGTRKYASYPTLFTEDRQPETDYILIPLTTSENRKYIPLGYFSKEYIVNNSCSFVPDGNLYLFGVLMSEMHMTFTKYVCGRLENRYRYSNVIVYNNFPFPENKSDKNIKKVEECAEEVLNVRKEFPNSSLADLYDPIAMPKKLVDVHNKLDKAVDLCYRPQPFPTELSRLEFLFDLYKKYTNPIFAGPKKKRKKSI